MIESPLEEVIHADPSLSYLSRILTISEPLPDPLPDTLSTHPHLTVFAPSNDAFTNTFDDIERRYLEGGYGSEGAARVIAGSIVLSVGKGEVGWQDAWGKKGYEGAFEASSFGVAVDDPQSNRHLVVACSSKHRQTGA